MRQRSVQRGMSLPGMLAIAMMVGFFALCAIRMLPLYFEYLSIKNIIKTIVAEYDPTNDSVADVRSSISKRFNTNQIDSLDPREVEVYRKEGKTHIDATYEVRLPIAWRIDAVMKFDDLVYVAGERMQGD
jgi:hypothetical protein